MRHAAASALWLLPTVAALFATWSRLRAVSGPDTLWGDVALWGGLTLALGLTLHLLLRRRRAVLIGGVVVLTGGWAALAGELPRARSGQGPDILLVTLDTLRADHVGPQTPALQGLMDQGTAFTNAVSTAPLTAPAHASMLTGRDCPEHGLTANGDRLDVPTVVPALAEQGYATAAFLSSRVLDRDTGLDQGFELYADRWGWVGRQSVLPGGAQLLGQGVPERRGDAVVEQALAWWEAQSGPRFAWVHLYDAHSPYAPPPGFGPDAEERRRLVAEGLHGPPPEDGGEWVRTLPMRHAASQRALYAGEVAWLDHLVGQLLEAVGPDTIVLVLADHGEGFGEHDDPFAHGANLFEPVLRVPLILRWPARFKPGARSELVSIQAVAGTLAEAAGASWDTPGLERSPDRVLAFTPGQRSRVGLDAEPARLVAALRFQDAKLVLQEGAPAEGYDLGADPQELLPLPPEQLALEGQDTLQALMAAPPPPLDPARLEALKALGYITP